MASSTKATPLDSKRFRAIHRWARIAPRKARLVADMVRGMPVNDAVALLENHPKRAAYFFKKVVKSALANASQDLDVDLNSLVVAESVARACHESGELRKCAAW